MKLTISVEPSNQIISVDIPGSLTVADFKAYLEAETDISPSDQILQHNGRVMSENDKTIEDIGLTENDLVVLKSPPSSAPSTSTSTSDQNAIDTQVEMTRNQLLSNATLADNLRQTNPRLHSLLNDPAAFKREMLEYVQQAQAGGMNQSFANQEEIRRLEQNPDDPESQARILELIRQQQIEENMNLAYDISPESFTSVTMLYIDIKVNNQKVQAFVDSGAQSTIISPRLAEKVGIDRLIDRRFQGEARGVGSQKIMGKIHSVPIKIGDSNIEIPCSFMVLDTLVDLLFGLDMLRRHKCVIDLQKDALIVGDHIETKFLPESQIENNAFSGAPLGGQKLGGNIFSDPIPANVTPPPSRGPGEAAVKRQNTGSSQNFKEEDITQLIGLGFSRKEAVMALKQCNGNVEMAASMLFQ